MKRTLLWILVSLVTFGLGIGTALVWLGGTNGNVPTPEVAVMPSEEPVSPTQQPILAYCELANNPERYDGKVVRVSARLWFIMHGYSFQDKNCAGDAKQTGVVITSPAMEQIAKHLGTPEYNVWDLPEIIAVGKFTRVEPSRESDSVVDNTYLRFEVIRVENAAKY